MKLIFKKFLLIAGGLIVFWLLGGIIFVLFSINSKLDNTQFDIENRIAIAVKGTEIYADGVLYCSLNINYTDEEIYSERLISAFTNNHKINLHSHILLYLNFFNSDYVGATHSERLAKQLFPEASGNNLILIALELENLFLDGIYNVYCNSISFGSGVYGLEAAARYYFGKTAEELTDSDIIRLKNPNNLSGNPHVMLDNHGAFIDGLRQQLSQLLTYEQIYNGGYKVYSTLDIDVQNALDRTIVNETVPDFFQIGMIICDYNGNIVGAAGGATPSNGNSLNILNRATGPLSIGSTIKPISVYTLGINNNEITYSDLLQDIPLFGEWPQNYNRLNEGYITVAYAIRQSKNTTAVRLVEVLGLNSLSTLLREDFRFASLSKDDDSLQGIALGYLKGGVSLEELALAYQIFGNGGLYYEGSYFTKVVAFDGTVIFNSPNVVIPIVDSQTAGILNRLLRSNVILPDGMGINADMYGIEVIGKTGTTDNSHGINVNTLFVGATPSYIGAVWVGSDNQGVNRINGAFPQTTEVWRRVMERISHEKITFDIDRTLIIAEFCVVTGFISNSCDNIEQGWYKPDNLPKACTCTR